MPCRINSKVKCIGSFNRKITIFDRNISSPAFSVSTDVDADELFTNGIVRYASVKTLSGKTIFDSVGTERIVTTQFFIRYDKNITSENWIEYNLNRYDIVSVDNIDEGFTFLSLKCIIRGLATKEASKA